MVVLVIFLLACAVAFAQQKPAEAQGDAKPASDSIAGKYEGMAKVSGGADTRLTLELKNAGGKVSGRLLSPQGAVEISEGTIVEGKLALKFGTGAKDGTLIARADGEKITGNWTTGTQRYSVELKKMPTATAASSPAVSLSGDWDGVADAQGEPFPFSLTLRVDGEKVTGSSSSQLGESTISTGTWKDGKLVFQLESSSGVISMSAVVVDSKLSGEFDYAGQLQGKWVAVRKTP